MTNQTNYSALHIYGHFEQIIIREYVRNRTTRTDTSTYLHSFLYSCNIKTREKLDLQLTYTHTLSLLLTPTIYPNDWRNCTFLIHSPTRFILISFFQRQLMPLIMMVIRCANRQTYNDMCSSVSLGRHWTILTVQLIEDDDDELSRPWSLIFSSIIYENAVRCYVILFLFS